MISPRRERDHSNLIRDTSVVECTNMAALVPDTLLQKPFIPGLNPSPSDSYINQTIFAMRFFRGIIVLFWLCCFLYSLNTLGILRRNHEVILQNHGSEGVPYNKTDNGESLSSLMLGRPDRESESIFKTKARDILVIMKTGATEHWDKIPVHLLTTFTRIPEALFFSDMEEYVGDVHLYDALDECNQSLKNNHPDFELYRNQYRLKNLGQSVQKSHLPGGWNLDKYKFPHLLNKTWSKRPTAKWYVFIEADTYLSWTGLLYMLDQFNPSLLTCIGLPLYTSGVRFAHGGAGYILSHTTMSRTVGRDVGFAGKYEAEASRIPYGDVILGKALLDYGIELVDARPMLQRDPPQMVAFDESNWCSPVVTLHHMSPSDINAVWALEKSKGVKRVSISPFSLVRTLLM
jgi:hypothetical protein